MEFGEILDYYEEELESGEYFEKFGAINQTINNRLDDTGDRTEIISIYKDNPKNAIDTLEQANNLFNSLDTDTMNSLEEIIAEFSNPLVQRDVRHILDMAHDLKVLKGGIGIKDVIENQAERHNIRSEDMYKFFTPITGSFAVQFYQDFSRIPGANEPDKPIDTDSAEATEIAEKYFRGYEGLVNGWTENFAEDVIPEDITSDGIRVTREEKQEMAERYGEIVWTVDRLLEYDNFTSILSFRQFRGMAFVRIRELVADAYGLPIENPYEMHDELKKAREGDLNEDPYFEFVPKYHRKTLDLIDDVGADLEILQTCPKRK